MAISKDLQIKALKLPKDKTKEKTTIGDGMYLLQNGSGKYFRYNYRYDGVSKVASLGVYPKITLKQAKLNLAKVKALISQGIDPNQKKKDEKQANREALRKKEAETIEDANTFKKIGEEWFSTVCNEWADSHAIKQQGRLQRHLYPKLGHIPITKLKRVEVVTALKAIQSPDIARRVGQMCKNILNYACDTGLIDAVPMGKIGSIVPKIIKKQVPAVTNPNEFGELLKAIGFYRGHPIVMQAMKLLPYLAVRSGEFLLTEWVEIDLKQAVWVIPAAHRKLKKDDKSDPANIHKVPLSKQVLALLKELHIITGQEKYVFPSINKAEQHLSETSLRKALEAMGYKGRHCIHGFRSSFNTIMKNLNPADDKLVECCLSHVEPNQVKRAYDRGDYWAHRVDIMQRWADVVDELRQT